MSDEPRNPNRHRVEEEARKGDAGLVREFFGFLMDNKKWWMVPLLLAFALVAALVFLGGTGAAPFIYTLF